MQHHLIIHLLALLLLLLQLVLSLLILLLLLVLFLIIVTMISDKLEYDYNSSQMKLTIDELTIKLEEKTMLLTKAKNAIDTLTLDNNKMRLEKG